MEISTTVSTGTEKLLGTRDMWVGCLICHAWERADLFCLPKVAAPMDASCLPQTFAAFDGSYLPRVLCRRCVAPASGIHCHRPQRISRNLALEKTVSCHRDDSRGDSVSDGWMVKDRADVRCGRLERVKCSDSRLSSLVEGYRDLLRTFYCKLGL